MVGNIWCRPFEKLLHGSLASPPEPCYASPSLVPFQPLSPGAPVKFGAGHGSALPGASASK